MDCNGREKLSIYKGEPAKRISATFRLIFLPLSFQIEQFMKISVLLVTLLSLPRLANAQQATPAPGRHTVSIGILGLAPSAGLEYEQHLGKHWALAVQGTRYFSADYPGNQVALVGRCYFRSAAPGGLYAQLSAGAFTHQGQASPERYPGSPVNQDTYPTTVHGQGGGLGLGYRWDLGPRLALNSLAGLKLYLHDINRKGGPTYVGDWYAAGQPGSVIDAQLSLSYLF